MSIICYFKVKGNTLSPTAIQSKQIILPMKQNEIKHGTYVKKSTKLRDRKYCTTKICFMINIEAYLQSSMCDDYID